MPAWPKRISLFPLLAVGLLATPALAQPAAEPPAAEPPAAEPPAGAPPAAEPPAAPAPEPPSAQSPPVEAEPPAVEPAAAEPAAAPAAEPAAAEPVAAEPPQPLLAPGAARSLPNYDGREPEPMDAGDVLIWVPRAVVSPVYLVSEYVLRKPIGALVGALDENDVADIVGDFFTFGPNDSSGVVPSALLDFGMRPSIGVYFFTDDVVAPNNAIRAHLAFGGADWYRATATVRQHLVPQTATTPGHQIEVRGVFSHRPDWLFFGLGPDSSSDAEAEYTAQRIDGTVAYEGGFWRSSRLAAWAGVRDVQYKDQEDNDDLTVRQAVARGFFEVPTLYDDGYLVARFGLDGSIDTRERRAAYEGDASDHISPTGSGVKIGLRAETGIGLRESPAAVPDGPSRVGFVRYGGTLGGYVDVFEQRVIGVQLVADFADPFEADGLIPFTELASLGGRRPLRGFLPMRMLGRSVGAALLEYRWPIWAYIDGVAHYGVGNAFGKYLDGFSAKKLRQSFGLGFRATGSRDHALEFLIGGGTDTFEEGGGMDSFRLVFGSDAGF